MEVALVKVTIFAFLLSFLFSLAQGYSLTLIHTNDNHARFDETDTYGYFCLPKDGQAGKCFGGMARKATMIKQIRSKEQNVLLLSAGDVFTGTIWYRVFRGNATWKFMNKLGYDAMVSWKPRGGRASDYLMVSGSSLFFSVKE